MFPKDINEKCQDTIGLATVRCLPFRQPVSPVLASCQGASQNQVQFHCTSLDAIKGSYSIANGPGQGGVGPGPLSGPAVCRITHLGRKA